MMPLIYVILKYAKGNTEEASKSIEEGTCIFLLIIYHNVDTSKYFFI